MRHDAALRGEAQSATRPLKVVYVNRKRHPQAFSLEELFHAIATEVSRHAEVVEYETRGRAKALSDARALRRLDADVYHVTGDITFMALLLPGRKTVVTIHDIGNFLFGLSGVKRWLYKWVWMVMPIRHAAAATVISEQTSANIERHLGVPRRRLRVIDNCYRPIFRPVPRPFADGCPVVLQVGTQSYKNVPRLLQALTGLKVRLVVVGRLDAALQRAIGESGIEVENRVGITNEALYELYVGCDIVSFVSIGEGFGMPIIEAQAVGRPVITANVSPMSDVAGNGACLVDPLDVGSIRAGLARILADPEYRRDLVEGGLQNVVRFSPERIAAQYLALYREVARP
mgnify:FL=1